MNAGRYFSYNLANASGTTIDSSPWGGEGGNPYLRAMTAWQFDLGYEHYFGQGGYVSIAGFYKKLSGFFYDNSVIVDFSGIDLPAAFDLGYITAPDNGDGGKIYGLEFSTSVPFENFSEALSGFGFLGSASFTESSVTETETSPELDLPGLSKTVLNGTLYYENNSGFQARVSARHRSSYLSEVFGLSQSREERRTSPETIIDAQLSYDLYELSGVDGLTMYIQGSNLTNEPFLTYEGDDNRMIRNWHTYGRSFMFGFSFKM
jgi:iron complex outermembrane receptor protein